MLRDRLIIETDFDGEKFCEVRDETNINHVKNFTLDIHGSLFISIFLLVNSALRCCAGDNGDKTSKFRNLRKYGKFR